MSPTGCEAAGMLPGMNIWLSSSLLDPARLIGLEGREENSDNPEESKTLLEHLRVVSSNLVSFKVFKGGVVEHRLEVGVGWLGNVE